MLLTATEFQLLLHMARQPGRVFTRAQLLDAVHGVAVESYERAIDAHVKNIRTKDRARSAVAAPPADGVRRRVPARGRRRMSDGPPWRRGEGRPSPVVARGRGRTVGRGSELGTPRQADRAAHRLLRGSRAARVPQRHLRRRLAAPQRIRSGQLGAVRHSGGGHRARARRASSSPWRSSCCDASRRRSARSSRAPTASRRATSRHACRCAARRISAPSHAR